MEQYRSVASRADRDAIPVEERSNYMLVLVVADLTIYMYATINGDLTDNRNWQATDIFEKGPQTYTLEIHTTKTAFTRLSFEQFCKDSIDAWCARLNTKAKRRRTSGTVTFRCSVYTDSVDSVELETFNVRPDDSLFIGEATFSVLQPFYKSIVVTETGNANFVEGALMLSCIAAHLK